MVIKREVAYGIVRGLGEFWRSEELQDFTVTVGSTQFGCHKFLLAACSGFFRGLLRSGMKETELKCADIKEISHKTFELVLETMYTGSGVLTEDNVIDIWRAAHQLQIIYLIEECEKFIVHSLSLDNYEDYFYYAKLLSRESVLETVWNFILNHFESFSKTETFVELSEIELLKLVKSQNLKVANENIVIKSILRWVDHDVMNIAGSYGDRNADSRKAFHVIESGEMVERDKTVGLASDKRKTDEFLSKATSDDVLTNDIKAEESVKDDEDKAPILSDTRQMDTTDEMCKKIEKCKVDESKVTSTRIEHMASLLSAARTCLASTDCLQQSTKHPKVEIDRKAREIILSAVFYNMQPGQRNGQWPSSKVYRNCAELESVALTCLTNEKNQFSNIRAYSITKNKWFKFTNVSQINNWLYPQCLNICDDVNIFSREEDELFRHTFSDSSWTTKKCSAGLDYDDESDMTLTVTETHIYVLLPGQGKILQMDFITNKSQELCAPTLTSSEAQHISTYANRILLFYTASTPNEKEETAVQSYDTVTMTWTRLNNLEGPAKRLCSFRNDQSSFILQTSGDLWKLVQPQSNVVDFEYVDTLWGVDWPLLGSVTHLDDLYIFGIASESHRNDPYQKKSLPGIFNRIIYIESEYTNCSTVVPAIVPKKHLQPY